MFDFKKLHPICLALFISCSHLFVVAKPPESCYQYGNNRNPSPYIGNWVDYVETGDRGTQVINEYCKDNRGTERSCSSHNRQRYSRPKYYKTKNCNLPDFNEGVFRSALDGRQLYFIGDSVIMQQKVRLKCDLKNSSMVKSIRVSHALHLKNRLSILARLASDCIAVVNVGLHYNSAKSYARFLADFERECLKKRCTNANIVWQETASQHFPGSINGYFRLRGPCKSGCTALSRTSLRSGDFRNRMANELMQKYQVPILKVWEITQGAYNMHVQFNSKSGLCDCTHFCNTPMGVFRAYNRVLQEWLLWNSPK